MMVAICCIEIDPIRRILSGGYFIKHIYRDIPPWSGIGIIYVLGVDFPHYIADETLLCRIIADDILHKPMYRDIPSWNGIGIVLTLVDVGKQVGGIQLDSSNNWICFNVVCWLFIISVWLSLWLKSLKAKI